MVIHPLGISCIACLDGCLECDYVKETPNNPRCHPGHCKPHHIQLSNMDCKACPDNCDECVYNAQNDKTMCSRHACETKFGQGLGGSCAPCPKNCVDCYYEAGKKTFTCAMCQVKFSFNNGECEACPDNCEQCHPGLSNLVCGRCEVRYTQITGDPHKSCVECPAKCVRCTYSYRRRRSECDECDEGYTVKSSDKTCTYNNHRKLFHRLGGSNSGRYGVTQNENAAMWIRKTKAAINRDEGSYKLPHMYNDVI
ncbi:hypothetical protein LSAT2_003329 [Lamellibrachia satsuma]|nr:hypothetical protein LSAT2_003329 [Lamellibrachia satsuma]